MANSTDAVFLVVVLPGDSSSALTYPNIYSLRTLGSCEVIDITRKSCASQNLPPPYSAVDNFSRLYMKIIPFSIFNGLVSLSTPQPISAEFIFPQSHSFYQSGDLIYFKITFSDSVIVMGNPFMQLQLGSGTADLIYYESPTANSIAFAMPLVDPNIQGVIFCSLHSQIYLNGGYITRAYGFIPIQDAFLQIQPLCCPNSDCGLSAEIVSSQPKVERVYSKQAGVLSAPSVVDIFVVFSRPVLIIGRLILDLYLPTGGAAEFDGNSPATVLHFTYTIQMQDYTSQLDYLSRYALHFADNNTSNSISLQGAAYGLPADSTLPESGSAGSLGRQSDIVIVMDIPRLVQVSVAPHLAVMGDPIMFTLLYTSAIVFIDSSGQVASMTAVQADASLSFVISPTSDINGTFASLGQPALPRSAEFFYQQRNQLVFLYEVAASDPTGYIELQSDLPLSFGNLMLVSSVFKSVTSSIVPQEYVSIPLASIDNVRPYVLSVSSNRLTTVYPLGAGDSVDVMVYFSAPVIAFNTSPAPTLTLLFANGAIANASFVNTSLPSAKLVFNYTILIGDDANPLMYDGQQALSGDIRRYTPGHSLLPANLTLPPENSFSSLGGTSNVKIDTSAPYVKSMFPVNKPGVFGTNETIIVVCRFSRPVIVGGTPQLTLQVGNGITGIATYKSSYALNDVRLQILDTDVIFEYAVGIDDDIPVLHHAGSDALQLPNGSYIFMKSTHPFQMADLVLRNYTDMDLSYGKIERQWMINYPVRVEVLLRDFYHSAPASLTATLEHNGVMLSMFSGDCAGKTFGSTYPRSRLGNNATAIPPDVDIGYDYFFSDTRAVDYASFGTAFQSSTSENYTADLAIDGNRDPYLSDLSVSATLSEFQPWWVVLLPDNTTVITISIWPRSPETWIPPVLQYTVKQLDGFPRGFYRLRFKNFDSNNVSNFVDSPFISLGASVAELSAALTQLTSLGDVLINPKILQMCSDGEIVFQCTDDSEFGYGYIYQLTLLNVLVMNHDFCVWN